MLISTRISQGVALAVGLFVFSPQSKAQDEEMIHQVHIGAEVTTQETGPNLTSNPGTSESRDSYGLEVRYLNTLYDHNTFQDIDIRGVVRQTRQGDIEGLQVPISVDARRVEALADDPGRVSFAYNVGGEATYMLVDEFSENYYGEMDEEATRDRYYGRLNIGLGPFFSLDDDGSYFDVSVNGNALFHTPRVQESVNVEDSDEVDLAVSLDLNSTIFIGENSRFRFSGAYGEILTDDDDATAAALQDSRFWEGRAEYLSGKHFSLGGAIESNEARYGTDEPVFTFGVRGGF